MVAHTKQKYITKLTLLSYICCHFDIECIKTVRYVHGVVA